MTDLIFAHRPSRAFSRVQEAPSISRSFQPGSRRTEEEIYHRRTATNRIAVVIPIRHAKISYEIERLTLLARLAVTSMESLD